LRQRKWNWKRRVERWFKTGVGYVLGPFTWLLLLVKYGTWYAAVFSLIAFVYLVKMLSPRPKRVMIDKKGELSGDPTILRAGNATVPRTHESPGRRRPGVRETTRRLEARRGQSGNLRTMPGPLSGPQARSRNTGVRKTFHILPPPRPRGVFNIFRSFSSHRSQQEAGRTTFFSQRQAKTKSTNTCQTVKPGDLHPFHNNFKNDLKRCATANGVFALVEENNSSLQFDFDGIENILERLSQVGSSAKETKRILALLKLHWLSECPVDERVVKLRCDPASGTISWNDKAKTSIFFIRWAGRDLHDIMTGVPNLRLSTLFSDGDGLLSWHLWRNRRVI